MKATLNVFAAAAFTGIIAYSISFAINYHDLIIHQPPHTLGEPMPPHVTSAPPYVAWLVAIPFGLAGFIGGFFVTLLVYPVKTRGSKHAS